MTKHQNSYSTTGFSLNTTWSVGSEREGHLVGLRGCRQMRHISATVQGRQRLVTHRPQVSAPIPFELDNACIHREARDYS